MIASSWAMAALLIFSSWTGYGPADRGGSNPLVVSKPEDKGGAAMRPEQLGKFFLEGKFETIYSRFSPEFKEQVSLKDVKKLGRSFNRGVKSYTLQSKMNVDGAYRYVWTDDSKSKGIVAIIDANKIIHGLQALPLQTYPDTDQAWSQTEFELPFRGEWDVVWGGTNVLLNYHYEHQSQRYAYDLVRMKDGSSYSGDGAKLESYYAFGQEVLAPAPGTIVKMENGKPDNEIGQTDAENPAGNHVVIDHGNGEFSYLAHFKQDSILVKPGDRVKSGQKLGLVGNSGNTSEPHIHYHVSDGPDLFEASSIRIKFKGGMDPLQGQKVTGVE
ncbi:M23 family metallopeptidase [Paenibacillus sp. FJAT-26967]|uniref:M23 family metallopeptidase n=1 Tax=Paenibacillus sp. FJAT-26967 TaxID=1729690 RepID=UPI000AE3A8E7|nr:M23 family metallopeptidase [Paenibacillus sp. FJAT-26967]